MKSVFHEGEIAVQKASGVEKMASRVGGSLKQTIHPVTQSFLRESPFIITASAASDKSVWASVLYGETGFIKVYDETRVEIHPAVHDEKLFRNVTETGRIGLLGIEFATRLRMRLNGRATVNGEKIEIVAEEVFSNCQKYIQARERVAGFDATAASETARGTEFSAEQQRLISGSDTFFIASYHDERGADASHRGGNPGFVKVIDKNTLLWPDYSGNMMFQTLGNIMTNGRAGLLFIDFSDGSSIQTTGRAEIVWGKSEISNLPGAERAVRFHVEKVVAKDAALPAEWRFIDYSPSNPQRD